jgi:hypothetical protein
MGVLLIAWGGSLDRFAFVQVASVYLALNAAFLLCLAWSERGAMAAARPGAVA